MEKAARDKAALEAATYHARATAEFVTLPEVDDPAVVEFWRLNALLKPTEEEQQQREMLWAKLTANAIPVDF
jgi:hypothetical protein